MINLSEMFHLGFVDDSPGVMFVVHSWVTLGLLYNLFLFLTANLKSKDSKMTISRFLLVMLEAPVLVTFWILGLVMGNPVYLKRPKRVPEIYKFHDVDLNGDL